MDRWKEYFLDTLAQAKKATSQVKKWQGERSGIFSGEVLRESAGYWVCQISDRLYMYETEPLKNITGEPLIPGDVVLIAFTIYPSVGYIIAKT